uniref:Hepcidin-like n=1 Tax=Oreochromis niloticus TaxID=8128 RepID=A0A669CG50_ORENI
MKTFSVAVAVAVVLTFICVQQSSAVPVTEQEQELEEPMSMDYPAAAHEEASVDSWKMLYNSRHKRGIKCRFAVAAAPPYLWSLLQVLRIPAPQPLSINNCMSQTMCEIILF